MLVSIVPLFQICISLHVTVVAVSCLMIDCFVTSMKLRVAINCLWTSPTSETPLYTYTALVLPLSTFIADEVFIFTIASRNYDTRYAAKQILHRFRVNTNICKQTIPFTAVGPWQELLYKFKDLNQFAFS